jgi:hypothetical protein
MVQPGVSGYAMRLSVDPLSPNGRSERRRDQAADVRLGVWHASLLSAAGSSLSRLVAWRQAGCKSCATMWHKNRPYGVIRDTILS